MKDRTIVLTDCGSGVAIAALGTVAATVSTTQRLWWVVLVTALVTGIATYVDEQRLTGVDVRTRAVVYVFAISVFAAIVVGVTLSGSAGISAAFTTGLTGFGVATFANRLVYSVVFAIPETRLRRAEQYSM